MLEQAGRQARCDKTARRRVPSLSRGRRVPFLGPLGHDTGVGKEVALQLLLALPASQPDRALPLVVASAYAGVWTLLPQGTPHPAPIFCGTLNPSLRASTLLPLAF